MMDRPNLRVLDIALCGWRLTVTLSWVPRRPAFSAQLWRCPGHCLHWWRWESESGL